MGGFVQDEISSKGICEIGRFVYCVLSYLFNNINYITRHGYIWQRMQHFTGTDCSCTEWSIIADLTNYSTGNEHHAMYWICSQIVSETVFGYNISYSDAMKCFGALYWIGGHCQARSWSGWGIGKLVSTYTGEILDNLLKHKTICGLEWYWWIADQVITLNWKKLTNWLIYAFCPWRKYVIYCTFKW